MSFYALVVGVPACLFVCWKPYRRKRLKRELAKANAELARLEKEVSDLTVRRDHVVSESVSFADHKTIPAKQQALPSDDFELSPTLNRSIPIAEPVLPKRHRAVESSEYLKYGGPEAELLNVDLMDGHEFEFWCASLLRKIGFQNVEVTPGSNDDGVDIIAVKDDIRYAIQCKRYSTDPGNTPIQEVHAGKSVYRCHVGAVMTNRHFTIGGKRTAEATGTLLWDRDWLRTQLASVDPPCDSPTLVPAAVPDSDELWPAAVDVILETGQASVSMIQRKLKLGYARSARIIDELEERGIVGPFDGSYPRSILITKEQWKALRK